MYRVNEKTLKVRWKSQRIGLSLQELLKMWTITNIFLRILLVKEFLFVMRLLCDSRVD